MKMKKYTASIAAIAIVMTFVSCGEKVEGSKAEKSRTETEASAVISASPTETSELSAAEESAEDSKTSVTGSETDPSSADENEWHVEFLSADVCKNIKNENGVKLWDDNSHDNMVYLIIYMNLYNNTDKKMNIFSRAFFISLIKERQCAAPFLYIKIKFMEVNYEINRNCKKSGRTWKNSASYGTAQNFSVEAA